MSDTLRKVKALLDQYDAACTAMHDGTGSLQEASYIHAQLEADAPELLRDLVAEIERLQANLDPLMVTVNATLRQRAEQAEAERDEWMQAWALACDERDRALGRMRKA